MSQRRCVLGYDNLKDEQKSVITKFVSGLEVMFSLYYPRGLEKVFVKLVLGKVFVTLIIATSGDAIVNIDNSR